jgi:antibiotic biosynthesis monooxygenase (ABM) superfamily enzyme
VLDVGCNGDTELQLILSNEEYRHMIMVHVEHYLNEAGRDYFPHWVKNAATILPRFNGYISIRQIVLIADTNTCHVLLEFGALDLLREWSSSQEHQDLITLLVPYQLQKWRSQIFEVGRVYTTPES